MTFNIFLLLVFIQFGRPQDFFPFLNSLRLALLFTLVALFLAIFNNRHFSFTESIKFKESKLYLLFFFIMIFGIPFAYYRRAAFNFVFFKYLANVLFFFLLVVNVQSIKKLKKVLFVVCLAVVFLAGMSLTHGEFRDGRFYPGTMYDPNDLAYFLVSFLPFFLIFIRKAEPIVNKIISTTGILLSLIVILLTGSRGGLLGLLVALFYILFSKIVIERKSIKILLCLIAVFTVSIYANKIDITRLQTITDLSSDYNMTSETGRMEIWKRGLSLSISNPLTGVGVICFSQAIGEQRGADQEIPKWQAPHNSYLQVLAETGFIGLWVFLSLIIASLLNFQKLSKRKKAGAFLTEDANIPGISLVGFCGSMTSAFFLTQGYSLIFTFYFAVSAVLRNFYEQEGVNGT